MSLRMKIIADELKKSKSFLVHKILPIYRSPTAPLNCEMTKYIVFRKRVEVIEGLSDGKGDR